MLILSCISLVRLSWRPKRVKSKSDTAVRTGNFGQHATHFTPETRTNFFIDLFVVQILYPMSIATTKYSILLFYRRIFNIPKTRIPLIAIGVAVTIWLVGVVRTLVLRYLTSLASLTSAQVLPAIWSCNPIPAFWTRDPHAVCIDSVSYFLGLAIPNIITDVVILLFPVPLIWNLKIPISQKLAILGIFLLGGFITIVSSLRLVSVVAAHGNKDITRKPQSPKNLTRHRSCNIVALLPLGVWNVVETNIGIVLACLPSMRPLLRIALGQKLNSTHHDTTVKSFVAGPWPRGQVKSMVNDDTGSFKRLNESSASSDRATPQFGQRTLVSTGGRSKALELRQISAPVDAIHVERDIEWGNSRKKENR